MEVTLSAALLQRIAGYIDEHYISRPAPAAMKASRVCMLPDEADGWCLESTPMCAPAAISQVSDLETLLKQLDAGFSESLLRLIDSTGKKDSDIYKKAGLSKQHFSKIRNNPDYRPTKATAIALALALELDPEGLQDLIGRAGYALTNSSKFDLIIRYFVERGNYNIIEINMALYEFDQPLLGV